MPPTTETITIIPNTPATSNHMPFIGERTLELVESLKIDEESKETLLNEAIDILSHCVFPSEKGNITNIAVGYVQSGKTMSFTTLSALAADNGFKVIVFLTGTKTNLQDQTYKRLRKDLNVSKNFDKYHIFDDTLRETFSDIQEISDFLEDPDYVLLFPILKHSKHIQTLANIFASTTVSELIKDKAVLIIDDEADQSSFNTYARKNSDKEDWEDDSYSSTYSSILSLRESFPCHSYVQYTATPQAAFLIDGNDILSPKYHTVLTPGKAYTGGKFFFKENDNHHIVTIPIEESYHWKYNPLSDRPETLEKSFLQFLVSVAITVFIKKKEDFLSMMVHVDGRTDTNEKFAVWVAALKQEWKEALNCPDQDPAKGIFISDLTEAYTKITELMDEKPSFDSVLKVLPKVILHTKVHLVQGGEDNEIKWDEAKGHVLVGADMLNRGFTIEKLSMTYMPRNSRGKSNADTIEQRCRFFGYKKDYADIIRIYLPQKSIDEFNAYVDHEEILRTNLKQCKSIEEFKQHANSMVISNILNPVRKNILSKKLIVNKMSGWRQMRSLACITENNTKFTELLKENEAKTQEFKDYKLPNRNHRYFTIPIEEFIAFLKGIQFKDVPNIARKVATMQYLLYLKESGKCQDVYIIEMAYLMEGGRKRKLEFSEKGKPIRPINLQAGKDTHDAEAYPGDREIKFEDSICFQFHKICIDDGGVKYGNRVLYNMAVYYPTELAEGYVNLAEDDEDDDE